MSLLQKIRNNTAYKKWRTCLRGKNSYCNICSTYLIPQKRQVHHITPLSILVKNAEVKFKDLGLSTKEFRKNIIIDILQYQYNNNIGIVVCEKCHNKIHGRI